MSEQVQAQAKSDTPTPQVSPITSEATLAQSQGDHGATQEHASEGNENSQAPAQVVVEQTKTDTLKAKLRAERKALEIQEQLKSEREKLHAEHKQRQAELDAKAKRFEQLEAWEKALDNEDPWEFMQAKGYNLKRLHELALRDDTKRAEAKALEEKVNELVKPLREETEALKQAEAKRQQELAEARSAEEAGFAKRIRDEFQNKLSVPEASEKFSLLAVHPQKLDLVMSIVTTDQKIHREAGLQSQMTFEDAMQAAEDLLFESEIKSNPLLNAKKARSFINAELDIVETAPSKAAEKVKPKAASPVKKMKEVAKPEIESKVYNKSSKKAVTKQSTSLVEQTKIQLREMEALHKKNLAKILGKSSR